MSVAAFVGQSCICHALVGHVNGKENSPSHGVLKSIFLFVCRLQVHVSEVRTGETGDRRLPWYEHLPC